MKMGFVFRNVAASLNGACTCDFFLSLPTILTRCTSVGIQQ